MKSTNWFYNTKAWQDCREAYTKSVGGLCERCLKQGLITPAEVVHHKIYLTPDNAHDPNITLNWNNLECLCRFHHEQEHTTRKKRFKVDGLGRVTAIDCPTVE